MPDGNDSKPTSAKDRILPLQLTAFPQSAALTHDAEQCVRDLDSELSTAGFLRVAKGHTPDSARHYKLFPLERIVIPPVGSPNYDKTISFYMKMEMENDEKITKVETITLKDWTTLCGAIEIACKDSRPWLNRQIRQLCDLGVFDPELIGYKDGPRAYAMAVQDILQPQGERPEWDKAYYENCLRKQQQEKLPDGAAGKSYRAQAEAFLERILPFLDRRPEAIAIMQHLINMMPPTLVTIHKRNLEKEFKANGQVQNASHIVDECYDLVTAAQKPEHMAKPTLVSAPVHLGYSLDQLLEMQHTCGMMFDLSTFAGPAPTRTPRPPKPGGGGEKGGKGPPGGDKEWCEQCTKGGGHLGKNGKKRPCMMNPYLEGVMPPGLWCVAEKKASTEAGRAANAEKESKRTGKTVTAKTLLAPSEGDIQGWKEWRAKMDKQKESKKAGTPGGVGIPDAASFWANIEELDHPEFGEGVSGMALASNPLLMGPAATRASMGEPAVYAALQQAVTERDEDAIRCLLGDGGYEGRLPELPTLWFRADWLRAIATGQKREEARVLNWHFRGEQEHSELHHPDHDIFEFGYDQFQEPASTIGYGDYVLAKEASMQLIFAVTQRREWDTIADAYDACGDALFPTSLTGTVTDANSAYQKMARFRMPLINSHTGKSNATIVTWCSAVWYTSLPRSFTSAAPRRFLSSRHTTRLIGAASPASRQGTEPSAPLPLSTDL